MRQLIIDLNDPKFGEKVNKIAAETMEKLKEAYLTFVKEQGWDINAKPTTDQEIALETHAIATAIAYNIASRQIIENIQSTGVDIVGISDTTTGDKTTGKKFDA